MAKWPYNSSRWKRLRQAKLRDQPLCEACPGITLASHVDHVHAISDGGLPFPGLGGLRSLCHSCHSQKTARGPEAGAVKTSRPIQPRKGCDAQGNPIDPRHPWAGKSLKADDWKTAAPHKIELVSKGNRNGR